MRKIVEIIALPDFKLECLFEDGAHKIADLNPLINSEVFAPLIKANAFSSTIVNHGYFIEWLGFDVDLSADTLWHLSNQMHTTPEKHPS